MEDKKDNVNPATPGAIPSPGSTIATIFESLLKGSFRLWYKDGSIQQVKLPSAAKVKLGGKANVMIVSPRDGRPANQRLLVIWFERVRGGWALIGALPKGIDSEAVPATPEQPK